MSPMSSSGAPTTEAIASLIYLGCKRSRVYNSIQSIVTTIHKVSPAEVIGDVPLPPAFLFASTSLGYSLRSHYECTRQPIEELLGRIANDTVFKIYLFPSQGQQFIRIILNTQSLSYVLLCEKALTNYGQKSPVV